MRGGAPAEVNRRSAQPRPTGGQLPFLGQVGIGGVRGSEGVALLVRGARAAAARPAKCRITERMTRPPTERFVHKVVARACLATFERIHQSRVVVPVHPRCGVG